MTNLLKELEAVVDRAIRARCENDDGLLIDAGFDAMDFLRTHHAEIAEAVKDARRYRWLKKNDNAYLLAEDVIDDAMHNSAREVGE
jgi:hypothetical protein